MLDFLDTLRQKPVHVRRQIAVLTTGVLSLLILSVWLNTWDIGRSPSQEKSSTGKAPTAVLVRGISGIKEQGMSLWNDSMAQINQVTATVSYAQKSPLGVSPATSSAPDPTLPTDNPGVLDTSNE
jgi:hypothetical protein